MTLDQVLGERQPAPPAPPRVFRPQRAAVAATLLDNAIAALEDAAYEICAAYHDGEYPNCPQDACKRHVVAVDLAREWFLS